MTAACNTCSAREWLAARDAGRAELALQPATHVSTWPAEAHPFLLCPEHAQLALIAGWRPVEVASETGQAQLARLQAIAGAVTPAAPIPAPESCSACIDERDCDNAPICAAIAEAYAEPKVAARGELGPARGIVWALAFSLPIWLALAWWLA